MSYDALDAINLRQESHATQVVQSRYALHRMLDEVVRSFRRDVQKFSRAAQSSIDSQSRRAALETRRPQQGVARVRRPASGVGARAFRQRLNPPGRFAFYQGEF